MHQRKTENILSAGIDIGTSTTKLIISRLSLRNTAGSTHMPRIEITEKEIIYKSPIFRTPLLTGTEINMEEVEKLVRDQYEEAGIRPEDIQTGAVIITGETATKSNAQEMINQLSEHAGDFLVATAGPDLESIIAAKGSGAYDFSKRSSKTIANIDIGGGTANIAIYRNAKLLGTCTLHIGGKLIEFSGQHVQYIAEPVKKVIENLGLSIHPGDEINENQLATITDYMADVIYSLVSGTLTPDEPLLLGKLLELEQPVDVIMFSGGVSECIYHSEHCKGNGLYNDIGVLLAQSLSQHDKLQTLEWMEPSETVRATVLGAGTQTTEISGATIQVESDQLPLLSLPVYTVEFDGEYSNVLERFPQLIEDAIELFDPNQEGVNFALYLSNIPLLGFKDMERLADCLVKADSQKEGQHPLIVILERDLAKSLGQMIKARHPSQQSICIDQIKVEHGDYLDIGRMLDSGVVPVIIKTLTFH
ncbi:ethanolamine ammonia-lyase reactivating factor EutA [Halobacillus sp. Marseille-Q1614]|uniref:ethanolamine ammonia-lyase reactivating factor EutA n=1 Tax=Halobacillus sp. Marseille-Q1614 TaxID=2709134 RepID=UPI0020C3F6F5|nr:ethanolamine ammonia-lyase reactivating factor EutA [Halobacillus sp. Marseille-Q1614]